MKKEQLQREIKSIESETCRLSMAVLDSQPEIGKELIRIGEQLLDLYKKAGSL